MVSPTPDADTSRRGMDRAAPRPFEGDWRFARRVAIFFGIGALFIGLAKVAGALILVFAAVLIGVIVHSFAENLHRYVRVPQKWSLPVATILLVAGSLLFMSLVGAQVAGQMRGIIESLPAAAESLGAKLGVEISRDDVHGLWSVDALSGLAFGRAASYGVMAFGVLANLVVAVAGGVFFASQPALYRDGALLLLPKHMRLRVREAMDATAVALRKWFGGQLVIMGTVALMSAVAYWLIGLPSWPGLAIVAGVTNFVPIVGPFIGGAIAVLMASTVDGSTVLWTIAAAFLIQEIESIFLVPRVQEYAVKMPPAVVLFAMLIFSALFGLLGLLLASPLAITAMIFVQKLWVRAALGERVEVAGS